MDKKEKKANQPARDTRCPQCSKELGNAVYGARMTCGCGVRLIMTMGGPSPRWEVINKNR